MGTEALSTWDKNVLALILESGVFAKFILLILLVLSIVAWMIYLYKLKEYRTLLNNFKKIFHQSSRSGESTDLRELFYHQQSAISRIFQQGEKVIKSGGRSMTGDDTAGLFAVELKQILESSVEEEATQLGGGLPFLGTAITVSPFLGLLGTVWGIMHAFLSIGASGNADLSTVAPGIAEALITTIAGLAVAIPAVFCYNHLNARLKRIEDAMYRLAGELTVYFSKRWHNEKAKIKNPVGN